jgi:hypothetical protein
LGAPGTLYESVVADSAQGISTQLPHELIWSCVKGASDAPKSTVRLVIEVMPPPSRSAST